MVFVNEDAVEDQVEVGAPEFRLGENVVEHVHHRFRDPVDANDRVFRVRHHLHLVLQTGDAVDALLDQRVEGLLDHIGVRARAHHVAHLLPLQGFEFLSRVVERGLQIGNGDCAVPDGDRLVFDRGLQGGKHPPGSGFQFFHVEFHRPIQHVGADVVRGASLRAAHVVSTAGVRLGKILPAHGEHG